MGGWMDGWINGKAGLGIAYSNQQTKLKSAVRTSSVFIIPMYIKNYIKNGVA